MRFKYLLIVALGSSMLLAAESKRNEQIGNQIHGEMEFLASDALQGRGSGTHDELIAATYLASELREIGIEPAGDSGTFIQNVATEARLHGEMRPWNTRNVLGILHGRDEKLKD